MRKLWAVAMVAIALLAAMTGNLGIIIFAIIIGIILLVFMANDALQDHVATADKPNYKILVTLARWKIINLSWLLIVDERRTKNNLPSIFNNGEGLYYGCENHCEGKNDIQLNYIKQTKEKSPSSSRDDKENIEDGK